MVTVATPNTVDIVCNDSTIRSRLFFGVDMKAIRPLALILVALAPRQGDTCSSLSEALHSHLVRLASGLATVQPVVLHALGWDESAFPVLFDNQKICAGRG